MPTYDYRCAECGFEFEEFQSMKDDPLVTCPQCGKPGLKRAFGSGVGLIFKGSGFYLTDYKSKLSVAASTASEKKEKKSESTSNSKPDSKPDSPKPSTPKSPETPSS
jgi:putative FmdB family regulatory protein